MVQGTGGGEGAGAGPRRGEAGAVRRDGRSGAARSSPERAPIPASAAAGRRLPCDSSRPGSAVPDWRRQRRRGAIPPGGRRGGGQTRLLACPLNATAVPSLGSAVPAIAIDPVAGGAEVTPRPLGSPARPLGCPARLTSGRGLGPVPGCPSNGAHSSADPPPPRLQPPPAPLGSQFEGSSCVALSAGIPADRSGSPVWRNSTDQNGPSCVATRGKAPAWRVWSRTSRVSTHGPGPGRA
jgi:hypothetical protein